MIMKWFSFLPSLALLLSACEQPSSPSFTTFHQNIVSGDSTVLFEVKKDAEGKVSAPAVPLYKNYVFDGWYPSPKGGERFDFSTPAPSDLYAHWVVYGDLSDGEKLTRYISRIQDLCPLVSSTRGYVETAVQYSTAEGIFTSVDILRAKRYQDITVIDHYYPKVCDSSSDLSNEEIQAGYTPEQINEKNRTLTEQDFFENGNFYTIFDYNETHPNFDSGSQDGKYVSKGKEDEVDAFLNIDFSSYFMGYLSRLAGLVNAEDSPMAPVSSLNEEFGNNSYWISEVNVSALDETKESGAFAFAYTSSAQMTSGNLWTELIQSSVEFALVNGKILHAQVSKMVSYYVDGDCMMYSNSLSVFDFEACEAYLPFEGERFSPASYPTYEE